MSVKRFESDRVIFLDDENEVQEIVYQKSKRRGPVLSFLIEHYLGGQQRKGAFVWNAAFFVLSVMFLEICMQLVSFGELTGDIVYPILFSIPTGILLSFFTGFFNPKVNGIISMVLTFLVCLYFNIQLVYQSIFGDFLALADMSNGADAIENFWAQMLHGIWEAKWEILLLFIPFFATIAIAIFKPIRFTKTSWITKGINFAGLCVLHVVCLLALLVGGKGPYTPWDCYTNPNTATNNSIAVLGVLTTARLEVQTVTLGLSVTNPDDLVHIDDSHLLGDLVQTSPEVDTSPNVMDIDFDKLAAEETNKSLKEMHEYFAAQTPSRKNEYTGYFEGYNLITFCAESFSSRMINPVLTPTLYKLSTEGFVFNNFYNSYHSNTTNGEYTFNMGIFPDLSRSKANGSFRKSANNYVPFCLGNMFKTVGVQPYAYHNYYGTYYTRYLSHPNMGYKFKTPGAGLNIRVQWPSSDLAMMEKSIKDYLSADQQFMAYYMTFSGHYQYTWNNPMAAKNRKEINEYCKENNLKYSETVKAFLACNLELEKALTYLMEQLEEAGVAEKTVIVLTNDHYPYGLNSTQYNELAGEKIDTTFEKYKNSFICWNGGMSEPVVVDTPCCTIDILPTLLNLFGFEYDSRLLMGRDVLDPNSFHVAILSNQSWITDKAKFDASRNKLTVIKEGDETVTDEYVQAIQSLVKNKFTMSTKILNKNYYKIVVPKSASVVAPSDKNNQTVTPQKPNNTTKPNNNNNNNTQSSSVSQGSSEPPSSSENQGASSEPATPGQPTVSQTPSTPAGSEDEQE